MSASTSRHTAAVSAARDGNRDARSRGRRRRWKAWAALIAALAVLGAAGPVSADEYDQDEAGHPLRLVAYVLHPVGVILDYMLVRPVHWLFSHEPLATLVGHEED